MPAPTAPIHNRPAIARTTSTLLAAALIVGSAACASDPSPAASSTTSTATDRPAAAPSAAVASDATEVDDPTCALLTVDEVSSTLGAPVTEIAVESPEGCQWVGGDTVNLFRFPTGRAAASLTEIERSWTANRATVTAVPGLGDEAIQVERPNVGTRYLAFQVGDEGGQFQSQATAAQLIALGQIVAPRL